MGEAFPPSHQAKYWLTEYTNYKNIAAPGHLTGQMQGTVLNPTGLYSIDSGSAESASVVVLALNNTEAHWDPQTINTGQVGPYRTGIQLCGPTTGTMAAASFGAAAANDSFIWQQNSGNTDLQSRSCPLFQDGCSETAVDYTIAPGSQPYTLANSVLKSTSINIEVWNAQLQPQTFSIKLVRANTNVAVRSANWGETSALAVANVKTVVNSMKFTNPQEFTTIWQHSFAMPGLRAGTPLKKYRIKKHFNLDYLRSAYRKVYAANSADLAKLAMQAESSYAFSPGFFNGCYFVLGSKLDSTNHIADVSQTLAPLGATSQGSVRFPQLRDQMGAGIVSPAAPGEPVGFNPLPRGSRFGYSGMVYVDHRVQSIRRHLPLTTFLAIDPLEQRIAALEAGHDDQQEHLDDLEEHVDNHVDDEDIHHTHTEGIHALTVGNHPYNPDLNGTYTSVGSLYRDTSPPRNFLESEDHHVFRRDTADTTYLIFSYGITGNATWYVSTQPLLAPDLDLAGLNSTNLGQTAQASIGLTWNPYSALDPQAYGHWPSAAYTPSHTMVGTYVTE